MNELEFLRESIIVLTKKVEVLEKWCQQHEVEGLKYGNEFEARDEKINNDIADVAERINLIATCVIGIEEDVKKLKKT